jgi:hypothetical protein
MQMQHVQDQCIVRACKGHRHALAAAPTTRVEPQNKIRTGRWRRLMARRPNRRLASLLSHRDTRWLPRNLFIPSPLSTIMASTRPHSVLISAARIKFLTPGVICISLFCWLLCSLTGFNPRRQGDGVCMALPLIPLFR